MLVLGLILKRNFAYFRACCPAVFGLVCVHWLVVHFIVPGDLTGQSSPL